MYAHDRGSCKFMQNNKIVSNAQCGVRIEKGANPHFENNIIAEGLQASGSVGDKGGQWAEGLRGNGPKHGPTHPCSAPPTPYAAPPPFRPTYHPTRSALPAPHAPCSTPPYSW